MINFPIAKINLGLNVVEKRPDGYHNLQTVFYPVPIKDVSTQAYDTNYYLYVRGTNANNYKWMQSASVVAPDNMADMGKGFWYFHRGDTTFTLQFAYPYDLSAE